MYTHLPFLHDYRFYVCYTNQLLIFTPPEIDLELFCGRSLPIARSLEKESKQHQLEHIQHRHG
tara:strand:+ start:174 stop:362 length:189 start_codon:yes stop_codon:yes gene_type:complete